MANYKLVDSKSRDRWDVLITSGPYAGVVVHINNLGFDEVDGGGKMSIDYDMVDSKGIELGDDWLQELGDTCSSLVWDSLAHQQAKRELEK